MIEGELQSMAKNQKIAMTLRKPDNFVEKSIEKDGISVLLD